MVASNRERERWELELKLAIGTASGLEGLATWTTESLRELDGKALKQAEPEVLSGFCRSVPTALADAGGVSGWA